MFVALALVPGWGCSRQSGDPVQDYQRGLAYFQEGKYAKAADLFEAALATATPTAQALNFLGVCQLYTDNPSAAVATFERALALDPSHVPAHFNLGLAKLETGDAAGAITHLRQVDRSEAPPAYTHYYLGEAYSRASAWAQAGEALRAHLRSQPPTADVLNALGVIAVHLKQYNEAEDWFSKALNQDANHAVAHLNLALIADHQFGRKQEAVTHYQSFLNLSPQSAERPQVAAALKAASAQLQARASQPPVTTPASPPAKPAPVTPSPPAPVPAPKPEPVQPVAPAPEPPAVVTAPPTPAPPAAPPAPTPPRRTAIVAANLKSGNRGQATAFFNEGVQHQQKGILSAAIAAYDKAIAADPSFAAAYYNRAITYRALGQTESAFTNYELALQANPDYADARFNYAILLQEKGFVTDAIEQYEKLIARNPNDAAAHLSVATLYARDRATLGKAKEHYQAYVRLSPNTALARDIRKWLDQHR